MGAERFERLNAKSRWEKSLIITFEMRNSDNKDISLGRLLLPSEVFNHFELVDVVSNDTQIDLFLDEQFVPHICISVGVSGKVTKY